MLPPQVKVKYISNKELLVEIGKSKASFCYFTSPEYVNFDAVVPSLDFLTQDLLFATLITKAAKLSSKTITIDPSSINPESVVFRVMTDSHLPPETDEKRRKKSSAGEWVKKTNFPPFKHYILVDGVPFEVGRSHWRDGLHNGSFCIVQGKISNRLAQMFMLLAEQYSNRGNWRGYCCDEMTEALTQRGWLSMDEITEDDIILSYDEGKLKWSKIKSIFRDDYDGKMFKLTVTGMDALVTPRHKFITDSGLKEVELLMEKDRIILTGEYDKDDKCILDIPSATDCLVKDIDILSVDYKGRVWCPETEYGSFMAKRNGTIYLTGNTYVDEMRGNALVHLSNVGLQFDEARSSNPFSFFTQIIKHCFTRVLNLEKRHQNTRDDLLIMAGVNPSFTRQVDNEMEQRTSLDGKPVVIEKLAAKRGRKPRAKV